MNTHIKTTSVSLTPVVSEHINKRLEKINHILRDEPAITYDLEIGRTTNRHQKGEIFFAEIHIVGKKNNVFARSEKADLIVAIDEVCEEALHSLTSRRKKYMAIVRRRGSQAKNIIKGLWPWKGEQE